MGAFHKAGLPAEKSKGVRAILFVLLSHALPARYSVLHLLDVLSGGNEPPFTQGSTFYVHLYLVNFPDKHCFCGHKIEALRQVGKDH